MIETRHSGSLQNSQNSTSGSEDQPYARDCAALGCTKDARQSRQLCSRHARAHAKAKQNKGKAGAIAFELKPGRCLGHTQRDKKKPKKLVSSDEASLPTSDQEYLPPTTAINNELLGEEQRSISATPSPRLPAIVASTSSPVRRRGRPPTRKNAVVKPFVLCNTESESTSQLYNSTLGQSQWSTLGEPSSPEKDMTSFVPASPALSTCSSADSDDESERASEKVHQQAIHKRTHRPKSTISYSRLDALVTAVLEASSTPEASEAGSSASPSPVSTPPSFAVDLASLLIKPPLGVTQMSFPILAPGVSDSPLCNRGTFVMALPHMHPFSNTQGIFTTIH